MYEAPTTLNIWRNEEKCQFSVKCVTKELKFRVIEPINYNDSYNNEVVRI